MDFSLPLYSKDIEKCIPHRSPFLLVDRITEYVREQSIVGVKNVTAGEPVLAGHFPGNPVFPGVLMIEGIAQTAAVLAHLSFGNLSEVLLTEVSNCRFKKPVLPGDQLVYKVQLQKARKPFYWYEGIAEVKGDLVAKIQLSALVR